MQNQQDIEATTDEAGTKPADAVEKALPQSRGPSDNGKSRWMIVVAVLLALLVVIGGVVVAILVTGGGESSDDEDPSVEPLPTNDDDASVLYEIRYASRVAPVNETLVSKYPLVWTYEWPTEPHVTTVGGDSAYDRYSLTFFPNGTDETQEFFFEYDKEFNPDGDLLEHWSMQLLSMDADGEAVIKATADITGNNLFSSEFHREWTLTVPLDVNRVFEPAEPMLADPPMLAHEGEFWGPWSYQPGVASFRVYMPPPRYTVDIHQFYAWSNAWTGIRWGPEELWGSSGPVDLGAVWTGEKYEILVTGVSAAGEATIRVTSLQSSCKNKNSFVLTATVDSGQYGPMSDSDSCYGKSDTMYVEQMKARIWSV